MEISFGKVIPVRVYADNRETNDVQVIKKAVRDLTSILHGRNTKYPDADHYKNIFRDYVPDYAMPSAPVDYKTPLVRSYIKDSYRFMLSGTEAEALNPYGKKIGPAKGEAKSLYGHTKTANVKEKINEYFAVIHSFIRDKQKRLKNDTELRIFVTGKDNKLDDIMFRAPQEPKRIPKEQLMLFDDSVLNKPPKEDLDSSFSKRPQNMRNARKKRNNKV